MNRSRHRVSVANILAIILFSGVMSLFCLAPGNAAVPFAPLTSTHFLTEVQPEPGTSGQAGSETGGPLSDVAGDGGGAPKGVLDTGTHESPSSTGQTEPAPTGEPPGEPAPSGGTSPVEDEQETVPEESVTPPVGTDPPVPTEPADPQDGETGGPDTGENDGGENDGGDSALDPGPSDEPAPADDGLTLRPEAAALPEATVGEEYSVRLQAEGGTGAYSYSVVSPLLLPLPEGLSLEPETGLISGVPTKVGQYSFTVEVSSGASMEEVRQTYTIGVKGVELGILAPAEDTGALRSAKVGQAVALSFDTAGGSGPYSYSIGGWQLAEPAGGEPASGALAARGSAAIAPEEEATQASAVESAKATTETLGNLPEGLTLDNAGLLSGVPTDAGAYEFTVISTDRYGSSTAEVFSLEVVPASYTGPSAAAPQEASPAAPRSPSAVNVEAVGDALPHTGTSAGLLLAASLTLAVAVVLLALRYAAGKTHSH